MSSLPQLSSPPTQPPFLPGRTSRAISLSGACPAVFPQRGWPGPPASASSIASGVVPEITDPPGLSTESSDFSHAAGRGAGCLAGPGGSGTRTDRTSATTCLQLNSTGQLHSPSSNSAGCRWVSEKNADVL